MEELVMQKFCISDTLSLLLALLLDDFLTVCYFLSSKPLHLVYMILFSAHIVQFLSFFSPLLFSTFLLVLVLLTVSPCLDMPHCLSFGYLGSTCSVLLHILSVDLEENVRIGSLEQYILIFFHSSYLNSGGDSEQVEEERPNMRSLEDVSDDDEFLDSFADIEDVGEKHIVSVLENSSIKAKNSISSFEGCVASDAKGTLMRGDILVSDNKVDESKCYSEKLESPDHYRGITLAKSSSIRMKKHEAGVPNLLQRDESMWMENELEFPLQRDNSMRKEKEWKKTLACKLYEERMKFKLCEDQKVTEGGEQMDLLWEAYEVNGSKLAKSKIKGNKAKKCEIEQEVEKEEDDEEGTTGKLCCLQALRLSTGKMNLGVGRPSLVKISKVFKGMAMFGIGSHSSKKR